MNAASERPGATPLLALDPPVAPTWVTEVLGEDAKDGAEVEVEGSRLEIVESPRYAFITLTFPGADSLDDEDFREATRIVYATLGDALDERGVPLLRVWNYIPGIRRPASSGSNRYELFNAGRFEVYDERYAERDFSPRFCAASAVGHRGADLVIHALAAHEPRTPIENPRQRPAYRYSRRYGPVPPSFARAMRLERPLRLGDGAHSAIVSGTASIVGEDTRHPGDTRLQLDETLQNLAHLSRALAGDSAATTDLELAGTAAQQALERYTDLRVYLLREDDAGETLSTLERTLPGLRRLEIAAADLCRTGLRVEIEGIARLEP